MPTRKRTSRLFFGLIAGVAGGIALARWLETVSHPAAVVLADKEEELPVPAFRKRIFNVDSFTRAVDEIVEHRDDVRAAMLDRRIDRPFMRRIMLAVTRVNGCRYCSYWHSRQALRGELSEEEVLGLLDGDLRFVPPEQRPAILFAQHYAEASGHPEPKAWRRLVETYGAEAANDILVYIRMITVGNLLGNTFDALLNRLRGRPAPDSSLGQELGVLAGSFVIIPARLARPKPIQLGA